MFASLIKETLELINGKINMKYSYNWLQKHIDAPLPIFGDLEQKIIFHAFEVEDVEEKDGDFIFEVKVLPDRAGDALSHYGMAREISGMMNLPLKKQEPNQYQKEEGLPVSIETHLCDRYSVAVIKNIKVEESLDFIKKPLESVGQKTINNIADATNYILLDIGQPTHAFDADKISGKIVVRMAKEGESIITLSDEEKILSQDDIVIADDIGPLAIAGIKGGKRAEINKDTKNIVLEAAHFDAVSIRKTARRLGLITDAAKRFENNISAEVVSIGMENLISLVKSVAGGEVESFTDIYNPQQEKRVISFTKKDITRILGDSITEESIEKIFSQYGYGFKKEGEEFILSVPYYRKDILAAEDIAEEVGRVYGYNLIPNSKLPFTPQRKENVLDLDIQKVRAFCINQGYSEVINYTFCKKGDITVARGPKNKSDLRTNLSDGLKVSFELNRLNAPLFGVVEVKIFEIGTIFKILDNEIFEEVRVAVADKNGVEEFSIKDFISKNSIEKNFFDLPESSQNFLAWSSYPFIVRDISVWIKEEDISTKEDLEKIIFDFTKENNMREAFVFDTFSKEGKTSFAYRLVFQSYEKTLTDDDVAKKIEPLITSISKISGVELR